MNQAKYTFYLYFGALWIVLEFARPSLGASYLHVFRFAKWNEKSFLVTPEEWT